jgi:hypothetical protein
MDVSLWVSIAALAVSSYAAVQARRAADVAQRADDRSATEARMRARPRFVSAGGDSISDSITFNLRNAGGRIVKLRPDRPDAAISPSEHLGNEERCSITFKPRPALPITVRIAYEDALGNADAISIRIRDGNNSTVLGYDSDS